MMTISGSLSVSLRAGVMGWPVSHSLSPRLHGFWLKQYGIAGHYEALPVEPGRLDEALKGLAQQGLRGVNLTVPHKEAACGIVGRLDPVARRIGAVNLVTVDENGALLGRNTDAYGFTQNLIMGGYRAQGPVLVLGAGGAARAIIVALADMGIAEIRLANRTLERAEKLAQEFTVAGCRIKAVAWNDATDAMRDVSLLVHTTSLGMKGQPPLEIDLENLPREACVTDIVYAPLETDLLRRARARGHAAIDGLGMLLHQARPSFAAFFGKDPEVTEGLRQFVLAGRE